MTNKILTACCVLALLSACSGGAKKGGHVDGYGSEECVDATEANNSLGTVYFGYDKYQLDHAAKEALSAQAKQIKEDKIAVKVEGYCDIRGTADYNMALGERRANAVKKYLRKHGVHKDKIEVISFGKERAAGTTDEARALDRKAVTVKQ
jgi:peptidoglycan-associated lipoprotein